MMRGFAPGIIGALLVAGVAVVLYAAFTAVQAQSAQAQGLIAFVTQDEPGIDANQDIYTMYGDGSSLHKLTDTPEAQEDDPAWSPDGTRLAFTSNETGKHEIFVMNADGSSVQQLTFLEGYSSDPAWSPDGTQIAFVSINDSINPYSRNIYTMNVDGSEINMVVKTQDEEWSPSWSPDGTQFAVQSGVFQQENIYILNVDGTRMRAVTRDGDRGRDVRPSWSPDGRYILFSSTRRSDDILYGGDLFVFSLEKNETFRITYSTEKAIDGSWSPDGKYVVYASGKDGNDLDIYITNGPSIGGLEERLVMDDDKNNSSPAWQPVSASAQ